MSNGPFSLNKQIALAPFQKSSEDKPKAKGLDLSDVTVTRLISTKVLFDADGFKAGDIVYFRSDVLRLPYSNQKLQLDETVFILMPEELVVLRQAALPLPALGAGRE